MEIVRPPTDVFEPPGSDIVFEAELNKDRVEVRWMRNNMVIVQGDKYQMISEGKVHRLQVCEIRPRDQGEYRIVAKEKDARAKLELAGRICSCKLLMQFGFSYKGTYFLMSCTFRFSYSKDQDHRSEPCNRCWKAFCDDGSLRCLSSC